MFNKITKTLGIILLGATLFSFIPLTGYAYGLNVNTIDATTITPTSAVLNSNVDTGGGPANVWFEYGPDTDFRLTTTSFSFHLGYVGNYSTSVYGLLPNTTYYFRIVGQNSYGKIFGPLRSFTTQYSSTLNNNYVYPNYIYPIDTTPTVTTPTVVNHQKIIYVTPPSSNTIPIFNNAGYLNNNLMNNYTAPTNPVLGANILNSDYGTFLPNTILGWLVILILLFIVIILIRKLRRN